MSSEQTTARPRICEGCGCSYPHRAPGSYTDEDGCEICPECAADLRATAALEGGFSDC